MNRFYGRRLGRRLRDGQRALLDGTLPAVAIPVPKKPDPPPIDLAALFGAYRHAHLEIGFGSGEHVFWQACRHEHDAFVAVEPYVPGVTGLLKKIGATGRSNIRIYPDDALDLLPRLPEAGFARVYVLFPDPWPKARHHKRRIVRGETMAAFARLLEDGGELRLASDDLSYVRWMTEALAAAPDFLWLARRPTDWRERPPDWPATRYEEKARAAGRWPVFLRARRRARLAPLA